MRNKTGQSIAEAAACMALLLPLLIAILYVILEISYGYLIKEVLQQSCRRAARELAIQYGQNPLIVNNRTLQNTLVFDNIRIHNILNNSKQFSDPVFNTLQNPMTVTTKVLYINNKYGLPPFPNPDLLHLGDSFQISCTSTYRLE